MWEQARCIGEDDLVVVCELPSYAVEVTEAVEMAHKNGAKVVTITDSAAAPCMQDSRAFLLLSPQTARL